MNLVIWVGSSPDPRGHVNTRVECGHCAAGRGLGLRGCPPDRLGQLPPAVLDVRRWLSGPMSSSSDPCPFLSGTFWILFINSTDHDVVTSYFCWLLSGALAGLTLLAPPSRCSPAGVGVGVGVGSRSSCTHAFYTAHSLVPAGRACHPPGERRLPLLSC